MFNGFNYTEQFDPTMSFTTLNGRQNFVIRAMKGQDETKLRTAIRSTPQERTRYLNSFMFNLIEEIDNKHPDFTEESYREALQSKISITDRDGIYFNVYMMAYGSKMNRSFTCANCGHEETKIVNLTKNVKAVPFPEKVLNGKNPMDLRFQYSCKTVDAVFEIKIPSLADESISDTITADQHDPSQRSIALFQMTDKIKYIPRGSKDTKIDPKNPDTWVVMDKKSNSIDVWAMIDELPPLDRKELISFVDKCFKDYGTTTCSIEYTCDSCAYSNSYDVNIYTDFFREVF